MGWDTQGARYRGRAEKENFAVLTNENGTIAAEGFIVCTMGPQAGQRIRFRGYISGAGGVNSPANAERASGELRAMGASLAKGWRDLSGIGTKEIEFSVAAEEGTNAQGKATTYYRASFVRSPTTINREREVSDVELEGLEPPPPPVAAQVNGRSDGPLPQAANAQEEAASELNF